MYPSVTMQMVKANSFDVLKECLAPYPEYYNLIKDMTDPKKAEELNIQSGMKTLDDMMFEALSKKFSIAFEEQFHYACVYGYIRLKEQEVKNVLWLAEMTSLGVKNQGDKNKGYILPFNY